jgi:hypothetical protein
MAESLKLLRTPRPMPDENFLGYVLRISEINGYENPQWLISKVVQKKFFSNYFKKSIDLSPLATFFGVSVNALKALMYQPGSRGGSTSKVKLISCGGVMMRCLLRLAHSKICPACIRETGYIRWAWDLVPVTICPNHKIVLLDKCPNCRKPISWNRRELGACRCGCNWLNISPPIVENHETLLSRLIYQLCNLTIKTYEDSESINALSRLNLEGVTSAIFAVASRYDRYGMHYKGSILTNSQIHQLLLKAYHVFDNWPNNFYEFLEHIRGQNPNIWTPRGIGREFKAFHRALHNELTSKQFDFMRDEYKHYLMNRWDGGYFSTDFLNQKQIVSEKWLISNQSICRTQRFHTSGRKTDIDATLNYFGKKKLIEKSFLIILQRISTEAKSRVLLSFMEVTERLGIGKKVLSDLIQLGCVRPKQGPGVDHRKSWKFDIESIKALLKDIEYRIFDNDNVDTSKELSFQATTKRFSPLHFRARYFVQLIRNGEIVPFGKARGAEKTGFAFSRKQIRDYCAIESKDREERYLTLKTAAEILKVKEETVHFFVKRGLFQKIKQVGRKGRHNITKISFQSLNKFIATNVFVKDIVKVWKVAPIHLIDCFDKKGIIPVWGPNEGYLKLYVYKKWDIALELPLYYYI